LLVTLGPQLRIAVTQLTISKRLSFAISTLV
jgi:hypothetical protein